jgi:hypothetical protein
MGCHGPNFDITFKLYGHAIGIVSEPDEHIAFMPKDAGRL